MTRANNRLDFLKPHVSLNPPRRGGMGGAQMLNNLRRSIRRLVPAGEAQDTLVGWIDEGIEVSLFRRNMQWHLRVGDRELSVEEYLLLFDQGNS